MQTYIFKSDIEYISNGEIFVTESGNGYAQNGELHITQSSFHFVYKFNEISKGWYMKNNKTQQDVFLGYGASPSTEYEIVNIKDQTAWDKIILPVDNSFVEEQYENE